MSDEEEVITRCLRAGAAGYVLKDASPSELLHAIEVVRGGGQYLSSLALKKVVRQHVQESKPAATGYELLTDREREVLKLLADGRAVKDIAAHLLLSVKTIDAHKTNMMRKLDLHDRGEVIKYAIKQRLIRLNGSRSTCKFQIAANEHELTQIRNLLFACVRVQSQLSRTLQEGICVF